VAFASSGCSGLAAVSAATARALTRDHPRRKIGKPRPTSAERVRSDPAKSRQKHSASLSPQSRRGHLSRYAVHEYEPFDRGDLGVDEDDAMKPSTLTCRLAAGWARLHRRRSDGPAMDK
jgi:hypothetical protein